ncbi:hypothetical protein HanRHA438_Chr09g0386521 [Helianthus annuus]|uniref:Uncharacterized protein n=1 Tax=Helianthus annuus TaxID=4232 RepID=A0A251TWE6_HELAN|nr:hypothetical protein HanXRQr2_Chr09g0374411 [Helianthus annuus]KAJ0533060.1 hypothetical protein HanIR_Chr09g0404071 [Helianthus annuus]KAJ0752450.1 hypothetical protein HanPI659440_Chr09g0324541 [Helianthus annuus]KAJ0887061.1 hypothetical protein HanRHA438_Chr09g0386521 [Helianthus annuus]KAJ0892025.1 hypothetical protein HanPSC8_Chr09g0360991 [Helianthus annuus]
MENTYRSKYTISFLSVFPLKTLAPPTYFVQLSGFLFRFVHQFAVKFDFDLTTIFLSVIFFCSDYGFLTNPFTVTTMEKSESVVAKTREEHRFRLVGREREEEGDGGFKRFRIC